jgi:hypothetical protein
MKQFLIALLLLTSIASYSQGGVRLFFEKSNQFYKQTIITFSESTTDQADNCCDALRLPGSEQAIWSYIGTGEYIINSFGYLTEDKLIQLGTSAFPDTGTFTIGVDQVIGDTLSYVLIDNYISGYHTLPYTFQGPVSNRFSILFERPLQIEVENGCEVGYIIINNDEPSVPYTLLNENNEVSYLPSYTDTIYDLPSGDYTLCLYDSIPEQINFSINNTVIDASLYLPYTTIYIGDSYIVPVLNIYSLYDSIEWDFGDGNTTSNDLNPVHYYAQAGIYNLRVIVTEGICEKIFEAQIIVDNLANINYVNAFKHKPTNYYYTIDGKLVKKL